MKKRKHKNILLTGASGHLGQEILKSGIFPKTLKQIYNSMNSGKAGYIAELVP